LYLYGLIRTVELPYYTLCLPQSDARAVDGRNAELYPGGRKRTGDAKTLTTSVPGAVAHPVPVSCSSETSATSGHWLGGVDALRARPAYWLSYHLRKLSKL